MFLIHVVEHCFLPKKKALAAILVQDGMTSPTLPKHLYNQRREASRAINTGHERSDFIRTVANGKKRNGMSRVENGRYLLVQREILLTSGDSVVLIEKTLNTDNDLASNSGVRGFLGVGGGRRGALGQPAWAITVQVAVAISNSS